MPKRLSSLEEVLEAISPREKATIRFIAKWKKTHRFPDAPSHRDLLAHLNKVLPKQSDGSDALVSLEQTRRIADQLCAMGVLVSGEGVYKMPRNLVLSPRGEESRLGCSRHRRHRAGRFSLLREVNWSTHGWRA